MVERETKVLRKRVDFDNVVKMVQFVNENPKTIAVFDGDEQVSEEISGIQGDELIWFYDGYVAAKENERLKSKGAV
jgi:hypothetical protein